MASRMKTKVVAVGIGGAVATLLIWGLNTFLLPPDKLITGEIAAAMTTVVTFVVGYITPAGRDEVVQT